MQIGDTVMYDGRVHVVIGCTPMSVMPAQIELRDPATGVTVWAHERLVTSSPAPERAASLLIPRQGPRDRG